MSNEVLWNKPLLDEFDRLACLSEEELAIMETRMRGYTITRQSIELSMSESKINRLIAKMKLKYDMVQPYSEILPPRRKSQKEKYLDEH